MNKNIKLVLSTTDPQEAEDALQKEILSGIATNLSSARQIIELCKKYNQLIPVSVEAAPEQAKALADEVDYKNLVVRVPINWDSASAIEELNKNNLRVECSGGMNEAQAILAASSGASYFSLQASRIKDLGGDPALVIKNSRKLLKDFGTQLIVGDVRSNIRDAVDAFLAGADMVAVPLDVLKKMSSHPKTTENIIRFINAFQQWGKTP